MVRSLVDWKITIFNKSLEHIHLKHVSGLLLCISLTYLVQYQPQYSLEPRWRIHGNWSDFPVTSNFCKQLDKDYIFCFDSTKKGVSKYDTHFGRPNSGGVVLPKLRAAGFVSVPLKADDHLINMDISEDGEIVLLLTAKFALFGVNMATESLDFSTYLPSYAYTGHFQLKSSALTLIDSFVIAGVSFEHDHDGKEEHANEIVMAPFEGRFVLYAFNWRNGSLLWQKTPDDWTDANHKNYIDQPLISPELRSFWKLRLHKMLMTDTHGKERPWEEYTGALMAHMSHDWSYMQDSTISLSNLWKGSGSGPSNATPNGLAIHSHDGVELIDLHSGQIRTRLLLTEHPGVSYYFHTPDQLAVVELQSFVDSESEKLDCVAKSTSLSDSASVVWHANGLCEPLGWNEERQRPRDNKALEDTSKMVPPIVIDKVSKATGLRAILDHLMGIKHDTAKDYLVLLSDGHLYSYTYSELPNWAVKTTAKWLIESVESSDTIEYKMFRPSMNIHKFRNRNLVIVVGWRSINIVNLVDGSIFLRHSLPCAATAKPAFDEVDGVLTIQCTDILIAFHVVEQMPKWTVVILAGALLSAFLFLSWLCNPNNIILKAVFEDSQL